MVRLTGYRTETITNQYFEDLETILDAVLSMNHTFVVLGDVNIHVDILDDAHGGGSMRLFDAFGMRQYIQALKHYRGHTLDFVVASDTTLMGSIELHDVGRPSDHKEIYLEMQRMASKEEASTTITRN